MKIQLQNVRLAFPEIFAAKSYNEGDPAFSATFIFAPDHPSHAVIKAAIKEIATAKWGAKAQDVLKAIMAKDAVCLHDGDTKTQYEGFSGNLFVSSRNKMRPLVIDRDKTPLTASDGRPYAGCYVYASIELWAQDNKFGKRINASLSGIQFYQDGDAFSGTGAASSDDFSDLAVNSADADLL